MSDLPLREQAIIMAFGAIVEEMGPLSAVALIAEFCDVEAKHTCPDGDKCPYTSFVSLLSKDLLDVLEKQRVLQKNLAQQIGGSHARTSH
jgi:hypothetical protein